jgi:hypothetical protein
VGVAAEHVGSMSASHFTDLDFRWRRRYNGRNPKWARLLLVWSAALDALLCHLTPAQYAFAGMSVFRSDGSRHKMRLSTDWGILIGSFVVAFFPLFIGACYDELCTGGTRSAVLTFSQMYAALELETRDKFFGKRVKRMVNLVRQELAGKSSNSNPRFGALTASKGNRTTHLVSSTALYSNLNYIVVASAIRSCGSLAFLIMSAASVRLEFGYLSFQPLYAALLVIVIIPSNAVLSWIYIRVFQVSPSIVLNSAAHSD